LRAIRAALGGTSVHPVHYVYPLTSARNTSLRYVGVTTDLKL